MYKNFENSVHKSVDNGSLMGKLTRMRSLYIFAAVLLFVGVKHIYGQCLTKLSIRCEIFTAVFNF